MSTAGTAPPPPPRGTARDDSPIRSLSIVLPAYNEEANLEGAVRAAIRQLDAWRIEGEVIVVDDGSVDATPQVAHAWTQRDPRVRAVRHPKNRGYGAALRTGFAASQCEHIFFTDADLQFDIREIALLEPWADHFDIIVGYRHPRQDSPMRLVNAWGWNVLVNGLFGLGVRDVDCAFKVIHRRVIERVEVRSGGAFVNAELLARAFAAGFRVKEVPVSHFPRRAGSATGAHPKVIARAFVELAGLYRELRR